VGREHGNGAVRGLAHGSDGEQQGEVEWFGLEKRRLRAISSLPTMT